MAQVELASNDPIDPVLIEHLCEEIRIEGRLQQRYNYLRYTFERDGLTLTARAYCDQPGEVSILGILDADVTAAAGPASAGLKADALSFLKRRYKKVRDLTAAGYADL